jgi:XTP/dITP diphosphohydrolase
VKHLQPSELLLATRSSDKAREIGQILAPVFHGRLRTLADAGIEPTPAEEDIEVFDSFVANAHAKAAYFLSLTGLPTLADDSGLCVHALGGAPGVRSRRFAAAPGLDGLQLDAANNQRLLQALQGVEASRRSAHYACAAVLHLPHPGALRYVALGTCSGRILESPRGSAGFGYDPLFFDPVSNGAFAEMEPAEKNRRSHRARAFRALAAMLPTL